MRFGGLFVVLALPLMVACKLLPTTLNEPPTVAAGQGGIFETALADNSGEASGMRNRPRARPAAIESGVRADVVAQTAKPLSAEVALPEPAVQKSKAQLICEKRGGNWGNAGKSNLKTCISRTKDAGKQCRKQSDCSSVCLARSGTCAPVKPLFGCNDILQKDGSRVTLCID